MVLVMQIDALFLDSLAFEGIDEVEVEAATAAFGTVEAVVRGRAVAAACSDCGLFSDRVHDRYQRRLKDLPLADQSFVIRLTVRRFICGSADCPRRTFVEPFRDWPPRTHGSPRGSTALWSGWGSPWRGGLALGWLPSSASVRGG